MNNIIILTSLISYTIDGNNLWHLYSLGFPSPAHFQYGRGELVLFAVQKPPLYTSLWQLTARGRRHAVAFNVGSVK